MAVDGRDRVERPDGVSLQNYARVVDAEPVSIDRFAALTAGVLRFIEGRRTRSIAAVVAALWSVVFGLDLLTGPHVSFSIFYLLPISVVSLRLGHRGGVIAAVLGAITWFVADRIGGQDGFGGLVPMWNGLVRLGLFLIVSVLLVAVRDLLVAQRREARVDALTGVYNPRGFRERAQVELDRAVRTGRPISMAYIDLDHFKRLNDARGHSVGDEALRRIGAALDACVRGLDVVGRVGGDEFAIVFPETGAAESATAVRRTRLQLRPLCAEYDIDVSIGVVTFHEPPANLDAALQRADALMYEAKAAGRGLVRFDSLEPLAEADESTEAVPAESVDPGAVLPVSLPPAR